MSETLKLDERSEVEVSLDALQTYLKENPIGSPGAQALNDENLRRGHSTILAELLSRGATEEASRERIVLEICEARIEDRKASLPGYTRSRSKVIELVNRVVEACYKDPSAAKDSLVSPPYFLSESSSYPSYLSYYLISGAIQKAGELNNP